jgi:ribosome-associated protein
MIRVTDEISIDERDLSEAFVRSGGPGGQHVNKVSTAVQLRFDVKGSNLPPEVKARLGRMAGSAVTSDGGLIIVAREFRKREMNRAAALERLVELVRKAAIRPKKRIRTKPSRASKERRISAKKRVGLAKKARRKVGQND